MWNLIEQVIFRTVSKGLYTKKLSANVCLLLVNFSIDLGNYKNLEDLQTDFTYIVFFILINSVSLKYEYARKLYVKKWNLAIDNVVWPGSEYMLEFESTFNKADWHYTRRDKHSWASLFCTVK